MLIIRRASILTSVTMFPEPTVPELMSFAEGNTLRFAAGIAVAIL